MRHMHLLYCLCSAFFIRPHKPHIYFIMGIFGALTAHLLPRVESNEITKERSLSRAGREKDCVIVNRRQIHKRGVNISKGKQFSFEWKESLQFRSKTMIDIFVSNFA